MDKLIWRLTANRDVKRPPAATAVRGRFDVLAAEGAAIEMRSFVTKPAPQVTDSTIRH
jgi:hypothetical protein